MKKLVLTTLTILLFSSTSFAVGADFFDDFIEAQPLSEKAQEILKEEVRKTGGEKDVIPVIDIPFWDEIIDWFSSF